LKRRVLLGIIIVLAVVLFFLVPLVQTQTTGFGGESNYSAWVSPSFAIFQCGVVVGQVGHYVSNGTVVVPHAQSLWDCGYPRV
jgi:hypothetical protein